MGSLPVAAIDKTLILKAIQPIWTNKNKTAVRTLRIIKAVLDYAKVNGWREGDNPAVWTGNFAHAFPTLSSNKHHPALPFVAVADFMEKLSVDKSIAAHALEFAILTGARSGEVRAARWAEIDMASSGWCPPHGPRRKKSIACRFGRALAILKALPREEGDYVFIACARANR